VAVSKANTNILCRLLGVVGNAPLPLYEVLVAAPHSLRIQAERGAVLADNAPGHEDSWGIGWFDAEGRSSLLRQLGSAMQSSSFIFAAQTATQTTGASGPAQVLLGHLRKASCGDVTNENAHPILINQTLFIHNGTVRPPLLETLREDLLWAGQRREAESDSDTVVLAHWLDAQCLAYPTYREGLIASLNLLLERSRRLGGEAADTYSALNLLIATPEGLWALRQFTNNPQYYTLYQKALPTGGWVLASEPTEDPESDAGDSSNAWWLLPPGELRFYGVAGGEPDKIALQ
jgi:predicted glutamine amidotransferase